MRDGKAVSRGACSGVAGARTSDFRLAFALVLLKSKPPAVTLRGGRLSSISPSKCSANRHVDYIVSLRRHVRQGSQADSATSRHLHLDSLQFWKEQYDALNASEMELRKKVFVLEKQLLAERATGALSASVRHPHEGQRDSGGEATSHVEQALQNNLSPRAQPGFGEMDDFSTAFNSSSPATDSKLQTLPTISRYKPPPNVATSGAAHMSGKPSTQVDGLKQLVLSSICAIARERKDIATSCRTRGANRGGLFSREIEDREVGDIFKGIFKIFKYLLKGLNIISSSGTSVSQGRVIYGFVRLFVNIMDCLSIGSTFEAPAKKGPSGSAPKKVRGRNAANSIRDPATPRAGDIHMRLSQLLINMIAVLDQTQKGHAELYEGFQFALFTRIGQRLSFFVFGEELPNPLDELRRESLKGGNPPGGQDTASRQLEAWCLIWLLERVMVDLHDSNPACKPPGRATDASGDAQSLLRESKARIRSTLLKGVFGEDAEEFDGLQMPILPSGSRCGSDGIQGEINARLCTPELFVREVWRLVGWQILAGDDLL
ncbi:MAG: hypothetical protein M1840_005019 [Geoglossum simile]|nr:MAG: hypothetical protein M1840_005019 [Geoglossum simile]